MKFDVIKLREKMIEIERASDAHADFIESRVESSLGALLEMSMTGSADYVQSRYEEIMKKEI